MQLFRVVATMATVLALAPPVAAERHDTVVPVLWQAPSCSHDKLGQVSIQVGTRVTEETRDLLVPTVGYAAGFSRLASAAQARGADAVVVRWHQATYYTRSGRRSRKPVHLQMRGAAIRTHADARPCGFAHADPAEFEKRARSGEPVEVGSEDAYSE